MRIRILLFTLMGMRIRGPYFHSHADPDMDPTFQFDAGSKQSRILSATTHFFPALDPPFIKNDPLRLPPFHLDADPEHAFHFDAFPDPAFHFNADPDPASQLMQIHADLDPQHWS